MFRVDRQNDNTDTKFIWKNWALWLFRVKCCIFFGDSPFKSKKINRQLGKKMKTSWLLIKDTNKGRTELNEISGECEIS